MASCQKRFATPKRPGSARAANTRPNRHAMHVALLSVRRLQSRRGQRLQRAAPHGTRPFCPIVRGQPLSLSVAPARDSATQSSPTLDSSWVAGQMDVKEGNQHGSALFPGLISLWRALPSAAVHHIVVDRRVEEGTTARSVRSHEPRCFCARRGPTVPCIPDPAAVRVLPALCHRLLFPA